MRANRSTHWEMFWIGGRAGCGLPWVGSGPSSFVISAMSTNSKFRIFFTIRVGSVAAGLNGRGLVGIVMVEV